MENPLLALWRSQWDKSALHDQIILEAVKNIDLSFQKWILSYIAAVRVVQGLQRAVDITGL